MHMPGKCLVWSVLVLGAMESIFSASNSGLEDLILSAPPMKTYTPILDENGTSLYRDQNLLGTIPDSEWQGVADAKILPFNQNHKVEKTKGGFFRGKALPGSSRGSKANLQKPPKPFPHEPDPTAEGCGNPICVVIDRKPRRFKSLCGFVSFLKQTGREMQVNFVQKGDCYDIIDSNNGAEKKPWINPKTIKDNCAACKKNVDCNTKVSIVIDMANIFFGHSSAYGGPTFHEHERDGRRMSGIPRGFGDICSAMVFMMSLDNINIKTQVIGFGIGEVNTLFPVQGENCLWTEWFDHQTPCTRDLDSERHSDHKSYLDISYTGPVRICQVSNMISAQHKGGSEHSAVTADDAISGQALGYDYTGKAKLNTTFKQILTMSNVKVECVNKQQPIKQLPPPFIYNDDKNNTCLDYKSRYCCKSQCMFRATSICTFLGKVAITSLPIGAAIATYKLGSNNTVEYARVLIHNGVSGSKISVIEIKYTDDKEKIATLTEDGRTIQLHVKKKHNTITGGGKAMTIFSLKSVDNNKLYTVGMITIEILLNQQKKYAQSVKLETELNINSETRLEESKGTDSGTFTFNCDIVDSIGQKQIVVLNVVGNQIIPVLSRGSITITSQNLTSITSIFKKLETFRVTYGIEILVESPPLATLFAECDWKDWINKDYPNQIEGLNGEYELRDTHTGDHATMAHACGVVPENAHYVDAVTMETQTPWAELKMGEWVYETFKLTPFFGYACKDVNGLPAFCLDMKVRYCCGKKMRATWGEWGTWSACTSKCAEGVRTRKRSCLQSQLQSDSSNYDHTCYGQEDYHTEAAKRRFCEQTSMCIVSDCPADFKWTSWCAWSQCSISCGAGTKERKRDCLHAKAGGMECPNWLTNATLFVQTTPCTEKDCERFGYTSWQAWSSCSATCGKGVQRKKRQCMSSETMGVVADKLCTTDENQFIEDKTCLLAACPVHGGWAKWSLWSVCNQECVSYPGEGVKIVSTKAYRSRRRYCANPSPMNGGKECVTVEAEGVKYLSNEKAEEQRTSCITLNNVPQNYNGEVTKWCPEHCIYSMWGAWSQCSKTCLEVNIANLQLQPDKKGISAARETNDMRPLDYNYCTANSIFPTRQRVRVIVKEERFGGLCPEKSSHYQTPSSNNGTVIWQQEDCKLCGEHCFGSLNTLNLTNIRFFPKLTYPGKDGACIGHCEVSCSMGETERTKDCTKEFEEYVKKSIKEKKGNEVRDMCFWSHAAEEAGAIGNKELVAEIRVTLEQMEVEIQKTKAVNDVEDLEIVEKTRDGDNIKTLQKLKETNRDKFKVVRRALRDDVDDLIELMENKEVRHIKAPVLDGLFGGKACELNINGKKKLAYSGNEYPDGNGKFSEKLNEDTQTFNEHESSWAYPCAPTICMPEVITNTPAQPGIACEMYAWSPWGAWGKCNETCGDEGLRPRQRTCQNICDKDKKKVEPGKCKAYHDAISGRKWVDEYWGPCTPCPVNRIGTWSEWTTWSSTQEFKCSPGGKEKYEMTRKRECIQGDNIRKCNPINGKTGPVIEEKMELPAGKCPPDTPKE